MNLTLKHTSDEALVWVTDLATGKPVAGQPVSLYGPPASRRQGPPAGDATGTLIGSASTDADGLFRLRFPRPSTPGATSTPSARWTA